MPKGVYKRKGTQYELLAELVATATDLCLEWPHKLDNFGYGMIWFDGATRHANRVAFLIANGSYPKHFACHTCDNRRCVNPRHLFDGTHAENMADAVAKRRFPRGSEAPTARSAKTDPNRVFELASIGYRHRDIAKFLGISQPYVSRILSGQRRSHASRAA